MESDAAQPCEVSVLEKATPPGEIVTGVLDGTVGAADVFNSEMPDDGNEGVWIQNVEAQDLKDEGIGTWSAEIRVDTCGIATKAKDFTTPDVNGQDMETCGAETKLAEVPKFATTEVDIVEAGGENVENLFFHYLGYLEDFFCTLGNVTLETKSAVVEALIPNGHYSFQRIFNQLRTISSLLFSSHECPRVDRLEVELSMLLDEAITKVNLEIATATVSASDLPVDAVSDEADALSVPTLGAGTVTVIQEQDPACGIADR